MWSSAQAHAAPRFVRCYSSQGRRRCSGNVCALCDLGPSPLCDGLTQHLVLRTLLCASLECSPAVMLCADGCCEHRRGASLWTLLQHAAWHDGLAASACTLSWAPWGLAELSLASPSGQPCFSPPSQTSPIGHPHPARLTLIAAVFLRSTFLPSPSRCAQWKQNVNLESFELLT